MTEPLLIESVMPQADATLAVHTIVAADPATTFRAVRDLDFLDVRTPLLMVAMWIRGLPERLRGSAPPAPPQLRLQDMAAMRGWLLLGETPGTEIAFGAVGRFWQPVIEWLPTAAEDFPGFVDPGWGKIAANFSVRGYGEQHTLLSYECRTITTDPDSRRRFMRYWWLVRPFVAHIMRATVATIKADAESGRRTSGVEPDTSSSSRH